MPKIARAQLVEEILDWLSKDAMFDVRGAPAHIADEKSKKIIAEMMADKFPNRAPEADYAGAVSRLRNIPHSPLFMSRGERNDAIRLAAVAATNPKKIAVGSDTYLIRQMTAVERLRHQNENGEIPFRLREGK